MIAIEVKIGVVIFHQNQRVALASRNRAPIRYARNSDRRTTVCRGSVTQLTISVSSPCPHRSVVLDGIAAKLTAGNRYGIPQPAYLHGKGAGCRRSVAQFTGTIISPRPHRSIAFYSETMTESSGDRDDIAEPAYLHGQGTARKGPIA